VTVRHSKTDAGKRVIPLNDGAWQAILALYHRAQKIEAREPKHYVFPAYEKGHIDPRTPRKSWRSAWRTLRREAGLAGFRFHDLRHHAITELAESGASDQTIMAIAEHVSREMLEHQFDQPANLAAIAKWGTLARRRFDACHRSYCPCIPIHNSGLVPSASESRKAISADIPALPLSMRDRAARVTPKCLAASVMDTPPR
jgi:hypothetical protein